MPKSSNILTSTATYELWNDQYKTTPNENAKNNWWGTADDLQIQGKIYDWVDDTSKAKVDYTPFQSGPLMDCPISPPTGLSATGSGGAIVLSWNPNPEPDVAGYKVF